MAFHLEQFYFNNRDIIDSLSLKTRKALERGMVKRKFKVGKLIYREGKQPKGVYILRQGKVKIYQTSQDARKQVMYIYIIGEMFGFRPIISKEPHPVSAAALEDCVCDFIPRAHFETCLKKFADLSHALLVSLSHEFTVWTNKLLVLARYPVKARVALGLLILHEKYKMDGSPGEVNMSRSEFASYIGTVKEMVVRVVQELRSKKIIETQGSKIRILKPEELQAIVKFY